MCCHHSDLFNTDSSLIRTLRSVPSVFVLERFDCKLQLYSRCLYSLGVLPQNTKTALVCPFQRGYDLWSCHLTCSMDVRQVS